ncbi:hypothetical protein RUND412_004973 [Rhizina undulata]
MDTSTYIADSNNSVSLPGISKELDKFLPPDLDRQDILELAKYTLGCIRSHVHACQELQKRFADKERECMEYEETLRQHMSSYVGVLEQYSSRHNVLQQRNDSLFWLEVAYEEAKDRHVSAVLNNKPPESPTAKEIWAAFFQQYPNIGKKSILATAGESFSSQMLPAPATIAMPSNISGAKIEHSNTTSKTVENSVLPKPPATSQNISTVFGNKEIEATPDNSSGDA